MSLLSPSPSSEPSKFFTDYYAAAVLLLVILFLAGSLWVIRPPILLTKETNAQTLLRLQTLNQERAYLSSLQQSVIAAQSIPPTILDQVNQALPDDPNVPLILLQISSAAARHQLRVDSLAITSPPRIVSSLQNAVDRSIVPLEVTLGIRSHNYFDIKRFFADVESSLRLMDVIGITASGAGDELSYLIQLKTYAFASPTKGSAATSTRL